MIDHTVIRDLARATGCERELADKEVDAIRRKLACSFVDQLLDNAKPEPASQEVPRNDNGKEKCGRGA